MADRAADALGDALEEKRKIYQRLKEVRALVDAATDTTERMRQTERLKILRDM